MNFSPIADFAKSFANYLCFIPSFGERIGMLDVYFLAEFYRNSIAQIQIILFVVEYLTCAAKS